MRKKDEQMASARGKLSLMAKDPAAVKLGRKGGKARAESQSAEQLSDIGKKGAKSRWENATEAERKALGAKLAASRKKGKKKKVKG